jgi:hypothetical protein
MSKRINQLAINDEGFVFDPMSGNSFTVNSTGISILEKLKAGREIAEIVTLIQDEFTETTDQIEREVSDFIALLQSHNLT